MTATTVDTRELEAYFARQLRALSGNAILGVLTKAAVPVRDEIAEIIRQEYYDSGETHRTTQIRLGNGREPSVTVGPATDYSVYGEYGIPGRNYRAVAFIRRGTVAAKTAFLREVAAGVVKEVVGV